MSSIKNQRIRSRKAKKLAIKRGRTLKQKSRERNLRSARAVKQLATVLENNNVENGPNYNWANYPTNAPPIANANGNANANPNANGNANTVGNLPYTNRELNTAEPVVGRPLRMKTLKSKSQLRKLKTRLARTLKQKQRERNIRKLRAVKEGEREREEADPNENVNLNYVYNEPEVWYEITAYYGDTYYYEPTREIAAWEPPGNVYLVSGEEDESSRKAFHKLMRKTQKKSLQIRKAKAMELFEAHPKNTFVIEIERNSRKEKITIKTLLDLLKKSQKPFTELRLVWIDTNIKNSYYYQFRYGRDFDNDDYNNYSDDNGYGYGYRARRRYAATYGFNKFKYNILEYFVPDLFKDSDDYYGYSFGYRGDSYDLADKYNGVYSWSHLKEWILNLNEVKAAKERIQQAKVSGPQKLEQLQLDALKRAYSRFEAKTGKDFPVNMQNLLESYMTAKKPVTQYYRERDNLAHIDTDLFQR